MVNSISLKCPECNAHLDAEYGHDYLFCTYCGTKIILENKNEYIYRHIDEADIHRAEAEHKRAEIYKSVRMRELELEEMEKEHSRKYIKLWVIVNITLMIIGLLGLIVSSAELETALLLSFISFGIGLLYLNIKRENENELTDGKIKVPRAVIDYNKKNYRIIQSALKNAGFTNIECNPMKDLAIGLFKKAGTVDSVTINGENIFPGQRFSPGDQVVISYHSFAGRDDS